MCYGLCGSDREKELGLATHLSAQAHPHRDRSTLAAMPTVVCRDGRWPHYRRFRSTSAGERPHCSVRGTSEGYSCRRRRLAVRPQLDWAGANQRILEDLLIDQMRNQCKWQVIKFITNAYGKIVEMIFESSKIIAIKL